MLILLCILFSCNSDKDQSEIHCYAQYICGLSLLQYQSVGTKDTVTAKAGKLRKLQAVTGVTANQVAVYLESIKEKPEKGQQLYEEMQRIFSERTDSIKNKTGR
jgi:hypothetical protein